MLKHCYTLHHKIDRLLLVAFLKCFILAFFHVKAKALMYLCIFHTAGKEYPVSDVFFTFRHSSPPSRTDIGRRQRRRSNLCEQSGYKQTTQNG